MVDCFSEMVNFVVIFEQRFYFLETVASVTVLGFADIVAGIGDGAGNGRIPHFILVMVFMISE